MTPRRKEQIGGLVIFLGSIFLIWFIWNTAFTEGYFLVKASGFAPAAAFMGLSLIIFPSYRLERQAKGEDISQLHGMQLITTRWWIILIIGLLIGFINIYLLEH